MGMRWLMLTAALAAVGCTTEFPIQLLDGAARVDGGPDAGRDGQTPFDGGRDASADGGCSHCAIAVTAGGNHTCLRMMQGAYCFGQNSAGQLGDGTHASRATPMPVLDLTGPLRAISAGDAHTCAIDDAGDVHCWGDNGWDGATQLQFRLGDGVAVANNPSPVLVVGVSGATQLAVGLWHSCALAGSEVRCWGQNASAELGVGDQVSHMTCTGATLTGASGVGAGMGVGCGITTTGAELQCWGYNVNGEVGAPGGIHLTPVPVQVMPSGSLAGVMQVDHDGEGTGAFAGHGCAVRTDNTLYCWGFNGDGELGIGSMDPQPVAVQVTGIEAVVEVAVGARHTCARTTAGEVRCWGRNDRGQLGYGDMNPRSTPGPAIDFGTRTIVGISAGFAHTCAIDDAGEALCWGADDAGQLGSTGGDALVPRPVEWP